MSGWLDLDAVDDGSDVLAAEVGAGAGGSSAHEAAALDIALAMPEPGELLGAIRPRLSIRRGVLNRRLQEVLAEAGVDARTRCALRQPPAADAGSEQQICEVAMECDETRFPDASMGVVSAASRPELSLGPLQRRFSEVLAQSPPAADEALDEAGCDVEKVMALFFKPSHTNSTIQRTTATPPIPPHIWVSLVVG